MAFTRFHFSLFPSTLVGSAERSIKCSIKFVNGGSSNSAASMTYLTPQNSHSCASQYRQARKEEQAILTWAVRCQASVPTQWRGPCIKWYKGHSHKHHDTARGCDITSNVMKLQRVSPAVSIPVTRTKYVPTISLWNKERWNQRFRSKLIWYNLYICVIWPFL